MNPESHRCEGPCRGTARTAALRALGPLVVAVWAASAPPLGAEDCSGPPPPPDGAAKIVACDDEVVYDPQALPVVVDVLANDVDSHGRPLPQATFLGSGEATVSANPDGTFSITPQGGGPIALTYLLGGSSATLVLRAAGSSGCGGLLQEAEAGERSGRFVEGLDAAASGGRYVHVPDAVAGGALPAIDEQDRIGFCFEVAVAGTYRIQGRHYSLGFGADSFFVRVDGQPAAGYLWVTQPFNRWEWDLVNDYGVADPVEVFLAPGPHQVEVFLREDGTRLDQIELLPP